MMQRSQPQPQSYPNPSSGPRAVFTPINRRRKYYRLKDLVEIFREMVSYRLILWSYRASTFAIIEDGGHARSGVIYSKQHPRHLLYVFTEDCNETMPRPNVWGSSCTESSCGTLSGSLPGKVDSLGEDGGSPRSETTWVQRHAHFGVYPYTGPPYR